MVEESRQAGKTEDQDVLEVARIIYDNCFLGTEQNGFLFQSFDEAIAEDIGAVECVIRAARVLVKPKPLKGHR